MRTVVGQVSHERGPRPLGRALLTQRLWLLQRTATAHRDTDDARLFTSAVAVLADSRVYVLMIRSDGADGTSASLLHTRWLEIDFQRNGCAFDSLDEAQSWAACARSRWLTHGWVDVTDTFDDT